MSNAVVVIQNLSKTYGEISALHDINIKVVQGESFGLIGPDGAGKTTLFRILTTLLLPDSGSVAVCGFDVQKDYKAVRASIGYMPERFSLYQDLTVEENLAFFASVFGTTIRANYELIRDIYEQIEPFKNRRAGDLSGGMKQKLALSCALIHKPQVIFLDEPTTGVDAVSRKEFWQMLAKLKQSGITILVSTPYMDEAELCDRVALIQHGRIMDIDRPGAITSTFSGPLFALKSKQMYRLMQCLKAYEHTKSAFAFGDSIHYTDVRAENPIEAIRQHLQRHGFDDLEIEEIRPGIEDTFMALMEHKSESL